MKPIIINIDEMSDSKEVYNSRPNPLFMIFTYSILILLVVALIWMYFGEIDIVVKSQGIIRPNNNISTIVNQTAGEIVELKIEDGQEVKEGQVLYIVDHVSLITEKDSLEEKVQDHESKLKMLNKYKQSIEDEKNYFSNEADEEEYYIRYLNYSLNYESLSHGINFEQLQLANEISNISPKLDEMNKKKYLLQKLKQSINEEKNLFDFQAEKEYYTQAEKYVLDYNGLLQQYMNNEEEIKMSTTEELVQNNSSKLEVDIKGYKELLESVDSGESLFESNSIYKKQYLEYRLKFDELKELYGQAKSIYEINKELEDYGVSKQEVENSRISMEKASSSIKEYKLSYKNNIESTILELEDQLEEHNLNKTSKLSKDELISKNKTEKENSIKKFELEASIQVDNNLEQLNENISNLETTYNKLLIDKDKNYITDIGEEKEGIYASILKFKVEELNRTIDNINLHNDEIKNLETSLSRINNDINNAVVKAQIDGVINFDTELVKGDVLMTGSEVLTIIPNEDARFKVSIYVDNHSIAKLREGMDIKYNIYALPSKEYGHVFGEVVKISKDIKVDQNNPGGYYLVEGVIENKSLYDYKGEAAHIKVGMNCEAQLITERKKILFYLLEKINLWDF